MITNEGIRLLVDGIPIPSIVVYEEGGRYLIAGFNSYMNELLNVPVAELDGVDVFSVLNATTNPSERIEIQNRILSAFHDCTSTGKTTILSCVPVAFGLTFELFDLFEVHHTLVKGDRNYILQCFKKLEVDKYPEQYHSLLGDNIRFRLELEDYKRALDSSAIVVFTNNEGQITYANDLFYETSGYEPAEVLGQTHKIVNSGYHSADFFAAMWETITAGKVWHGEVKNRSKKGTHSWMETVIVPFNDQHGKPIKYLCIRRDITRRKAMEDLLKESGEKYKILFEYSPVPMWILDIEAHQFLDVNLSALKLYGYTREEFVELIPDSLFSNDDDERRKALFASFKFLEGHSSSDELKHVTKQGNRIKVRIERSVIYLKGRKCLISHAIDITQNLEKQKELEQAYQRLATAQNIANLGFWSRDIATGISKWTDETYNIYELDTSVIPDMELVTSLFHPDDRYLLEGDVAKDFEANKTYEVEHRIITAKGNIKWVTQKLRIENDEFGAPSVMEGVILDITARKEIELADKRKSIYLSILNGFTTRLLFNGDWKCALSGVLTDIGASMPIDRVFYFEILGEEKDKYASLKLVWSKNDSCPPLEGTELEHIRWSSMATILDPLNKGRVLESRTSEVHDLQFRERLERQGIKSLLIAPVIVNKSLYGFLGFQDCKFERHWNNDEKSFVKSLTSNVSSYIEKTHSEIEVKINKEKFNNVINNLPGLAFRLLPNENFATDFINDEVVRVTGYTLDNFIGTQAFSILKLIHPDDLDVTLDIFRKLIDNQVNLIEFRIVCKDDTEVWLRGKCRAIFNEINEFVAIDAVMIDITEARKTEQLLVESNERFKLVTQATLEAIFDLDCTNGKTMWGDGFHDLFGYSTSDSENSLWIPNIHPDDKERVLNEIYNARHFSSKNQHYSEYRFLTADKKVRYVQHKSIFIRDKRGVTQRIIGAIIDVTESLERTRKIAEQNETLREIAWTQSHVVRSPLSNLMGLIGLLKERDSMELDLDDMLDKLSYEANRLDSIIQQIIRKTNNIELSKAFL